MISSSQRLLWAISAPLGAVSGSQTLAWALAQPSMVLTLEGAPTGLTGSIVVSIVTVDGSLVLYGPTSTAIQESPVASGRYVALVVQPDVGQYFAVWTYGATAAIADLEISEDPEAPVVSHTMGGGYWPEGTLVSVYLAAAWPDPTRAPSGVALASDTVTEGELTFHELEPELGYVAYALGHGVRFRIQPYISPDLTSVVPGQMRQEAIEAKLTAVAGLLGTSESFITEPPLESEVSARASADIALGARIDGVTAQVAAIQLGGRPTIEDEDQEALPPRANIQFSGSGVHTTDDDLGDRTTVSVVDEAANVRDPRWAGGAVGDAVVDDYAAVNAACLAAIAAPRGRVFVPQGTYRLTDGLVVTSDYFALDGVAGRRSTFMQDEGVHEDVLRFVTATAGSESNQGHIANMCFTTSTGGSRGDGKAGLALEGTRHVHVQDCNVDHLDIGFDMRSNCFGSRFIGCTSVGDRVRVGLLLRGATPSAPFTAGSGSDITLIDNWIGGLHGALWMEPNAGGYHVFGGQLKGGHPMVSDFDLHGSLLIGRGYDALTTTSADVTAGATSIPVTESGSTIFFASGGLAIGTNDVVTFSGKTGDLNGGTLTGVTGVAADIPSGTPIYNRGRVSTMELYGVSFEGTSKRHAVRAYGIMDNLSLHDCAVNSNGANRIINVIKGSDCQNSVIAIRRTAVRGTFTGTVPLVLAGLSGSWDVSEESPTNVETPTFNAVGMDFTSRPMVERSSIDSRSRAFFGPKIRFGGRTLRWNSTELESHTDSSSGSGWESAAIGAQQAWQTIAFATGTWDSSVSYFKDSLGLVWIRGDALTLTTGGVISSGTTLFTLPAGYRPVSTQKFPAIQVSTLVVATITAAGVVTLSGGLSNGNTLSFAGLAFRAEN